MESPTRQDLRTVLCQHWLESERGWGKRPDGYSLHKDRADFSAFMTQYWADMPPTAPDEYSRPDGSPYWADVDTATYAAIEASGTGLRRYSGAPPQEK